MVEFYKSKLYYTSPEEIHFTTVFPPDKFKEELKDQGDKNPISVHFRRQFFPGYHNRGHRKAIKKAWLEWMLDQITYIDPWETPWLDQWPKITTLSWLSQWVTDIVPNAPTIQN